jgi:hypothetical protein
MAKKKKKAVKKKKVTDSEHRFMVVDLSDETIVTVTKTKGAAEDAIAEKMTEDEIDEREASDRLVVYEICREFEIEAQPQYEVWLKERDKISADI